MKPKGEIKNEKNRIIIIRKIPKGLKNVFGSGNFVEARRL
ncbi:hypothetical protein BTJ44_03667 [Bacillus mycoides]|nr:hypothetical protein BTJ44_03667 [Bacillus mycoides]